MGKERRPRERPKSEEFGRGMGAGEWEPERRKTKRSSRIMGAE
jgi:hypothetical protein